MFSQFRLAGAGGSVPDETASVRSLQLSSTTFAAAATHSEATSSSTGAVSASAGSRTRATRGVRRPLSCATCIKKKTKCDRKLPCGSCVNRGDAVLCSFGPQGTAIRQAKECAELRQRMRKLEDLVREMREAEKALSSGGGLSPPSGSGPGGRSAIPPLSPATSASSTSSPPGQHDDDDKGGRTGVGVTAGSLEYDAKGGVSYADQSRWDCLLLEMGDLKNSLRNINILEASEDDYGDDPSAGGNGGSKDRQAQVPVSYSIFAPPTTTDAGEFILMLPPKPLVGYLVSRYMEVFSSLFHVLHEPTFMEDYKSFWDSPKQVSFSWLALLFVVLGLGVMSLGDDDPFLKEHLHMSLERGLDLNSYVKRYCDLAMRCLVADRFMERYRLSTIQCLILLIYSKNHSNDGSMSWALLGLTANLAAGLGCHKDGSNLNLDPVETEQRRRCWAAILMLDALQASAFGRPSMMHGSAFETRMPLDVNDVDITRTEVRKASSRPTQMTYLNLKFRLLNITSKIYDRLFGSKQIDYATIIDLDREIRKETESWPDSYADGDSNGRGSGLARLGAHDQVHWYILHGHLHQLLLLLHRPFFHRGAKNYPVTPGYSRTQCIESASTILEIYHILNTEPKYQPYRWYTYGLATFHAFHASVVIATELLSVNVVGNPHFSELWSSLQQAIGHFTRNSRRSPLAVNALPRVNVLRTAIESRIQKAALATPPQPPQPQPTVKEAVSTPLAIHHQQNALLPLQIQPDQLGYFSTPQVQYAQDMELDSWFGAGYMSDMSRWVSPGSFRWDEMDSLNFVPGVI